MGSCYRIIITWKQKISLDRSKIAGSGLYALSKAVRNSFTEEKIGDLLVRDTKIGETYFMFTWCEHDDEDWALSCIAKQIDLLQSKGLEFDSCCLDYLERMAFCRLKENDKKFIEDVLRKLNMIKTDDYEGLKRLYDGFGYVPNTASTEIEEKLLGITYFRSPSGETSCYFLKGNKIFFFNKLILGADLKSFKAITGNLAKDKDRVYSRERPVKAIPEKVKSLSPSHFTDGKHVFYLNHKMKADPDSFKVLNRGFSKDKYNVFYEHTALPEADPASFVVIDGPEIYGYDKKHVFIPDKFRIKTTNGDKWTLIARGQSGELISADNNHIFENEKPITDFGLEEMKILGNFACRIIIAPSGVYQFRPDRQMANRKDRFKQIFEHIPGADPKSFRQMDDSGRFYADDNKEYHLTYTI